jgi:hypothetical protein
VQQLAFDIDAPDPRRFPREPIARSASLCTIGTYRYRWWLSRAWSSAPMLGWVMLNPSNADERSDDPTLRRVIGFSYRWGYGGLVVVNPYPICSPSPAAMRAWRLTWADRGRPQNLEARGAWMRNLTEAADALSEVDHLVAAWGAAVPDPFELGMFLDAVEEPRPRRWFCLARTAAGDPMHPLARGRYRIADDVRPLPFIDSRSTS